MSSVVHRKVLQDKVTFYKKGSLNSGVGHPRTKTAANVGSHDKDKEYGSQRSSFGSEVEDNASVEHLIRKILIPNMGSLMLLFDALPQPTAYPDVNLQWYALVSLVVREFIKSWYSKISNDKDFVDEVINILVKITRQVESRLCDVDFETFLLDTLPAVLDAHVADYRLAKSRVNTALMPNMSLDAAFHSIRPHPALNDEESEKGYLNVMGHGVLVLVLDEPDLSSEILRSLALRIIVDLGLTNLVDKLSESWVIFELIGKLNRAQSGAEIRTELETETETVGEISTIKTQLSFLLTKILSTAKNNVKLMSRSIGYIASMSKSKVTTKMPNPPLVSRYIFPFFSHILQLPMRRPLLHATLQILAVPFTTEYIASAINRMTSDKLHEYFLIPSTAAQFLKLFRNILFPGNGRLMPAREIPDSVQQQVLRANAKEVLEGLLNHINGKTYNIMGGKAAEDAEAVLQMFESKLINKHLLLSILDLVIIETFPELKSDTPTNILKAKLASN
ncbi:hypothetical protein NADFUDRAFT_51576 [Nadsonia fulvescens var. elongata DSM 6958]|uniref:PXA domain-containing protein n=1 Tax=Nadsonia fulvescens var. elongata DSM 6958 TaxID=857566 RepID=A0A1E3PJF3_9ASCO|nr:hypothetical protein NADFUDRAFT_51576 [Nadsonia fulvescens var. elongata DSM 6958]